MEARREPLDLQVAHHGERALALAAEPVVERHAHAVEDELGGEGGAHAELVPPLLAQREAGHALLHEKRAQAALAGGGVDHEDVARRLVVDAAVGDEGLAAVEDVAVALPARARGHRQHVRPHLGLRHAQAADPLTRSGLGQHALPLERVAVDVDVLGEQHRVRQQRQREAGIRCGERLAHLHHGDRVQVGAAVLLGQRDAQQTQLAGPPEERVVEGLGPVVLGRLGLHLAGDEGLERLGQQGVLGRRREEVERLPALTGRFGHGYPDEAAREGAPPAAAPRSLPAAPPRRCISASAYPTRTGRWPRDRGSASRGR